MTEKRKSYRDDMADNLAGCDTILVPVKQASAIIAKCPRSIYALMATGELKAVKSGRNTLIIVQLDQRLRCQSANGED